MGVLFVFIVIVWLIVLAAKTMNKDKKPETIPPDLPDDSSPSEHKPLKPDPKPDPDSVTVYINAERFGDWVCRNCECENSGTSSRCCVCNRPR